MAKNILIMVRHGQTIDFSTDLGINYTSCWQIVLMFANVPCVSVRWGFWNTYLSDCT